jgi:hypothetical protein
MFVMTWAELRLLVISALSAGPGGKSPLQFAELFQSNVPLEVVVQRESPFALRVPIAILKIAARIKLALVSMASHLLIDNPIFLHRNVVQALEYEK